MSLAQSNASLDSQTENLDFANLVSEVTDTLGASCQSLDESPATVNDLAALASLDLSEDRLDLSVASLDGNALDATSSLLSLLDGDSDSADQTDVVGATGNAKLELQSVASLDSELSPASQLDGNLLGTTGDSLDDLYDADSTSSLSVVSAVLTSVSAAVSATLATMTLVVSAVLATVSATLATVTLVVSTVLTSVLASTTYYASDLAATTTYNTSGLAGDLASASHESLVARLAGTTNELASTTDGTLGSASNLTADSALDNADNANNTGDALAALAQLARNALGSTALLAGTSLANDTNTLGQLL